MLISPFTKPGRAVYTEGPRTGLVLHRNRSHRETTLGKNSSASRHPVTCTFCIYISFLAFSRVHTGSAARLCLLHLARFVTSSGARPTALISSMTESSTASWVFLMAGSLQGRDRALFLPQSPCHCAWCSHTILGGLPVFSPILRLLWVVAWRPHSLCGRGGSAQASTISIAWSIFISIAWRANSCFLVAGQHLAP